MVNGDWRNTYCDNFLCLDTDKEKQKEKYSEMTERLAVFFLLPGIIVLVVAFITQIEWVVWAAMGLIAIAMTVWCLDQM